MTHDHAKQIKTLQQLSHLIAHETDDEKVDQLVAELQAILHAEQKEIRQHVQATTGIQGKLA